MSPRPRTLSFVLILLSLNNGLILVASYAVGPAINIQPVLTEYYPSFESPTPQLVNSLLTVASANGVLTEVLPVVQKIFPDTQRLTMNDVLSFGSYPPGTTVTTSSYAVPNPNPFPTYSTSSAYLTPIETSNSLQIAQPFTETLTYPTQIESVTVIDQNYPPVTQTVQFEGFAPTANGAEVYQTPITVQIPSMPQLSPFIGVASPLPGNLPSQSQTPNVFPKIAPQIEETTITTVTSVPVETPTLSIPSSDICQQLPITLQINMASPWVPELVRAIVPPPQPAPSSSSCNSPASGMAPYPIVILEESRSMWKSILPILMLSLFDGESNNNYGGGGCSSQCGKTSFVPFPIVIPTNSPIISGSSRGKAKSKSSGSDNQ